MPRRDVTQTADEQFGSCSDDQKYHLWLYFAQCQHHSRQILCVYSGQGVAARPPNRHSCRLGLPGCLEQAVKAAVTLSPACRGKQQGQSCLGGCLGGGEHAPRPNFVALKAARIPTDSSGAGHEEPQGPMLTVEHPWAHDICGTARVLRPEEGLLCLIAFAGAGSGLARQNLSCSQHLCRVSNCVGCSPFGSFSAAWWPDI